jgi:hypothetical protein
VNGCYIIDPYMISNMYVPLFWPNLVCFGFHVARFVSVFLIVLGDLYFFWYLIRFVQVFFLYFWVYNLFYGFGFVFRLFSSQTNILGSVYGRTKNFKSTRSGWIKKNWDKGFNTLFGLPCFVKGFFFCLRVCLTNTF